MFRRGVVRAHVRRLSAIALLAAVLASGAAARAGEPTDSDRTLAGPDQGEDPIIGATDVLGPPDALTLRHPTVVTTARLLADGTSVNLFGIDGEAGEAAQGLQDYLAGAGDEVDCQPQPDKAYVCVTPGGTDIAEVALANGAARTKPNAPDSYREQEIAAQTGRRGLWANLPPPPEILRHPIVRDTATLASATQTYRLAGVTGLPSPYTEQLQGYIATHGDSVTCSPQDQAGTFVCLLPDGSDIAKVALAAGTARVDADAPDAYRTRQLDAVNNRRGIWLEAPDPVTADSPPPTPETEFVLAAGDEGTDGISYAGRTPMAVIGGAPVFLAFGAGLGWGYYDHERQWHAAPGRYRAHLDHFHPGGWGLPGFGYRGEAMRHEAALRPGEVFHHGSAWYGPPVRSGMPGTLDHPGMVGRPPPPAQPGMVEPFRRDGNRFGAPAGHPDLFRPAAPHPGGMAMAAPRFAVPPGGGFTNQRTAPHPGVPPRAMPAAAPPPHGNAAPVRRQ